MASVYFADNGRVMMRDGPWDVRLSESQCDTLLGIWDAANAITLFNALFDACQAAGWNPCTYARRPALRLVSPGPQEVVRSMLAASVASLDPQPPEAA